MLASSGRRDAINRLGLIRFAAEARTTLISTFSITVSAIIRQRQRWSFGDRYKEHADVATKNVGPYADYVRG